MRVLLISTYELGHQPLHVASPAAALRRAGHDVRCLDLAVEHWDPEAIDWAEGVALSVPMHTAMRLAIRTATAIRARRPDMPVCLYGLYAPVSRDMTVGSIADLVVGGEYEPALVRWADDLAAGTAGREEPPIQLGRQSFEPPARELLPPLERYARLAVGGEERLAGYVEASHGCVHMCRHCPIPPVYDGRIRIVGAETVVADVQRLVDAGARHITFGDPDFLNGVRHSLKIVREVHERFPELTFDCTTKVEHVLEHREVWPELAAAGCLFVVTALETMNDAILTRLDKGHTAAEAAAAVTLLREHGIEARPSFMPFTPWTTVDDVLAILAFVAEHDLIGNVDPVQYTIRLLLPEGSLLLEHPDMQPYLGDYDAERLGYDWRAADPAVDELHARLAALVEADVAAGAPAGETFDRIWREVATAAGDAAPPPPVPATPPEDRPRLTEAWFCCAEPTELQLEPLPDR